MVAPTTGAEWLSGTVSPKPLLLEADASISPCTTEAQDKAQSK